MHSILHILNTSTELMSAVELMSGAKSRKWVHQKPTNQPTNQPAHHIWTGPPLSVGRAFGQPKIRHPHNIVLSR